MQPVGEKVGRRAQHLLVIVIIGREVAARQEVANGGTAFGDARSAGAQDHPNTVGAVLCDRLAQGGLDLQRGGVQQLVVATVLLRQGNGWQWLHHGTHRRLALGDPACGRPHS